MGCCECSLAPDPNAPVTQTKAEAKQEAKCTLGGPNCPKIRERFTNLAGEVWDSLNELKIMLNNLNAHCSTTQRAISAMINNFDAVVIETNGRLSAATKDENTYNLNKEQKNRELRDVHKTHIDRMYECKTTIENLASEMCALRKIRGELLNMD